MRLPWDINTMLARIFYFFYADLTMAFTYTPVFTDASSAILLFKAGLLARVSHLFSIVLAARVADELCEPGYPGSAYFRRIQSHKNSRYHILPAEHGPAALWADPAFQSMDRGEQETLSLYMAHQSGSPGHTVSSFRDQGFVLMDDGKGARFCVAREIPFINALLVPKVLLYTGHLDTVSCDRACETLKTLGRYSARIIQRADHMSAQNLARFLPCRPRNFDHDA